MKREIERYNAAERSNHWAVAILFVLLALSGLALFHPALFWLSGLFGGGVWTRILHPFLGIAMFLLFLVMIARFARYNWLSANDRAWLGRWRDVVNNREEGLPEVGRYNAGQKLLFWLMLVCMLLLLVSGIAIWRQYFGPLFRIELIRLAAVVHAAAASVLIIGILVHIYAAIWVKGTIGAMLYGKVSRLWARKHHPGWYKEVGRK